MNTRCPPKSVPSAACFFTLCSLTVQPPQSYSVGGQRSSGQLTGKPAGAWPDYRGRWCASWLGSNFYDPLLTQTRYYRTRPKPANLQPSAAPSSYPRPDPL
ncbi:UNVERIFIED_CONTAM: hypothetical protein FKN15_058222 [Acipenser sinensis]